MSTSTNSNTVAPTAIYALGFDKNKNLDEYGQYIDRILRIEEVMVLLGLARPTIYKYVKSGKLPCPVSLGGRAMGWRMSDIQRWIGELSLAPVQHPDADIHGGEA